MAGAQSARSAAVVPPIGNTRFNRSLDRLSDIHLLSLRHSCLIAGNNRSEN